MTIERERCTGTTKAGGPCGSFAVRDGLCVSHHPELAQTKAEGSRRGGIEKANARRLAKAWAAYGDQLDSRDLPSVLRSCMFAVKDGDMDPAMANAIANLAKASVSIGETLDMEQRIRALEEAAGMMPANVRRFGT